MDGVSGCAYFPVIAIGNLWKGCASETALWVRSRGLATIAALSIALYCPYFDCIVALRKGGVWVSFRIFLGAA